MVICVAIASSEKLSLNEGDYDGQVFNGKPQGYGTMKYKDGGKYVGNWLDGQRHGDGILFIFNFASLNIYPK